MDAGGEMCVGTPVGGVPVHYSVIIDGDVIGILTVPSDPVSGEGMVATTDDDSPLLVTYLYLNECYSGILDTTNNRLTLTTQ
jgi:hypothetical protein